MPAFDIIRQSRPKETFRVKSIIGKFDLQQSEALEHFKGSIDLPEKWNIGLIVGHSGTGKSTIANELFGDRIIKGFEYTHDNILDDMPQDVEVNEIAKTLTAVGFSSPPSWLKPYHVLSNGEKMRCDIARAILTYKQEMFVFDEFTSVVDRTVAQVSSFAIQKAIRRKGGQFVAVTCHEDVQEWLMPDWVFDTNKMEFRLLDVEEQKKNRPALHIECFKTDNKEYYWNIFGKYHYLSHSYNKSGHCYVFTCNGSVCAFYATIYFPHPKTKNIYKGHRLVVLPDYQGVGIGSAVAGFVPQIYKKKGYRYLSTTSNPSLVFYYKNSKKWKITRIGRVKRQSTTTTTISMSRTTRVNCITVTAEYIG